MVRVSWVVSALAAILLIAAPSRSQTVANAPASYALSWVRAEGAEQCPASRVMVAEVEQRLGRRVFDAAAERSFEVEVTRVGEQYRSDVFLRDAGGRTLGHRALQSDERDCGALANATALAIALLIDPTAAEREPPRGVAAFDPPPPDAPPPPPVVAATPTTPVAAPVVRAADPPPLPCPPPARPALLASLRGEVALGLVPKTSPGVALAFRARHHSGWGLELGGAYLAPQNAARGTGSLDLGLTRADALVTFDLGGASTVRGVLGAGASVGAFHVAVRQPAPVTAPGDYWFSAARLLADVQVTVTKDIFVELGASAAAAIRRQEFLVRGQAEPVFRQARVSAVMFGGAGVQFQ